MAWLTRPSGKRYYYRSHRQGQTVTTEYIGAGSMANLLAQRDAQESLERKARQEGLRRQMAEQATIDRQLDAIGEQVKALAAAVMLASGYHTHRRQWRKQRASDND